MTPDVMFNALLGACKKYIDSIFSGYTTETKELAAFEKENMARYSGGAAIDHVLFRKFLRLLNRLYSIDLGELLLNLERDFEQHITEYKSFAVKVEEDIFILKNKNIYKVANTLPKDGEPNVIYLVPSTNGKDSNVKDEYIWVDGKWEMIGTTAVDLSGYYTSREIDNLLKDKANSSSIIVLTERINDLQTNKADKEDIYTRDEIDSMLDGLEIDAYTKAESDELLANKVDKSVIKLCQISIVGQHGQQTITLASMQSDEPQSE
jgi:hypothetical protein